MFNSNGSLKEEGWYESSGMLGKKTGPFRKDSEEYKYWEMKEEYFIK